MTNPQKSASEQLQEAVEAALTFLQSKIASPTPTLATSHLSVQITGVTDDPATIKEIAVYLVGAVASCISFNMSIRRVLFDEKSLPQDLLSSVTQIIGKDNTLSADRKRTERNPWMW